MFFGTYPEVSPLEVQTLATDTELSVVTGNKQPLAAQGVCSGRYPRYFDMRPGFTRSAKAQTFIELLRQWIRSENAQLQGHLSGRGGQLELL